eukprot:gene7850-2420_t
MAHAAPASRRRGARGRYAPRRAAAAQARAAGEGEVQKEKKQRNGYRAKWGKS